MISNYLKSLQIDNFRSILSADIELSPKLNIVIGDNGAGKTSLLESLFVLSRGQSFRCHTLSPLQNEQHSPTRVVGTLSDANETSVLGVEITHGRLSGRVKGETLKQRSELTQYWSTQAIDPNVHTLIDGGPESRRKFVDWGVFHVEHGFLEDWKHYKKALRQRNMALKARATDDEITAWDIELAKYGERVQCYRLDHIELIRHKAQEITKQLLNESVDIELVSGWDDQAHSLEEALLASRKQDRYMARTHVGPHKADISLLWQNQATRRRVSRGQQKLLGMGLQLAQAACLPTVPHQAKALLLDDPGAELDQHKRDKLTEVLEQLSMQMVMTLLDDSHFKSMKPDAMFHVEHGVLIRQA